MTALSLKTCMKKLQKIIHGRASRQNMFRFGGATWCFSPNKTRWSVKMLLMVKMCIGNNFLHMFTCKATNLDNVKSFFTK